MNYQYIDHKPSRRDFKINKHGLDRIKRRLDRIRAEQSEIYTRFKKKYYRHQLENIISEEELQDLHQEMLESGNISSAISLIEAGKGRRFSYL
ncbi:MAG: hypothetical protein JWN26_516 [Candidatus Saccharibacteria bacterium]|nr:hypothetical protein [Candidatus Saccharibacteria bacterium]